MHRGTQVHFHRKVRNRERFEPRPSASAASSLSIGRPEQKAQKTGLAMTALSKLQSYPNVYDEKYVYGWFVKVDKTLNMSLKDS